MVYQCQQLAQLDWLSSTVVRHCEDGDDCCHLFLLQMVHTNEEEMRKQRRSKLRQNCPPGWVQQHQGAYCKPTPWILLQRTRHQPGMFCVEMDAAVASPSRASVECGDDWFWG